MRIKHEASYAEKMAQWCMHLGLYQGLECEVSWHQSHGMRPQSAFVNSCHAMQAAGACAASS